MKKIVNWALLFAMLATILGLSTGNVASASPNNNKVATAASGVEAVTSVLCATKYRFQTDHWNDGTLGADEWWFTATVHYLYCVVSYSPDYAIPKFASGHYNFEGDSQNCNPLIAPNVMRQVRFNGYFWDGEGRNFNPGGFDVECSKRSYRTVTQYYDTHVKLYAVDGVPPKWKFNYDLARSSFFNDSHHYGYVSGHMRKCSGIGSNRCP